MDGDFTSFIAADALAEHSASGEAHLADAAYHFLMVRLYYEHVINTPLTSERFNELAYESWVAIVQGTLQTYHTWLAEVRAAPPEPMFEEILDSSREVFLDGVGRLKRDLITYRILEDD